MTLKSEDIIHKAEETLIQWQKEEITEGEAVMICATMTLMLNKKAIILKGRGFPEQIKND